MIRFGFVLMAVSFALMAVAATAQLVYEFRGPRFEIPPIEVVPTPKLKPGQRVTARMCVTFVPTMARIPGSNMVYQKMVAAGMKPCRLLEQGSFNWYMNGADI